MPASSEEEHAYFRVTIQSCDAEGNQLERRVSETCQEYILLPVQQDMEPRVISSVRPLSVPFFLLRALWSVLGLQPTKEGK